MMNLICCYYGFSWLESRIDQILIGCTMQLRLLYQSQDRSLKEIIQGYKALLRLLMAVILIFLSTLSLGQLFLTQKNKFLTNFDLQKSKIRLILA